MSEYEVNSSTYGNLEDKIEKINDSLNKVIQILNTSKEFSKSCNTSFEKAPKGDVIMSSDPILMYDVHQTANHCNKPEFSAKSIVERGNKIEQAKYTTFSRSGNHPCVRSQVSKSIPLIEIRQVQEFDSQHIKPGSDISDHKAEALIDLKKVYEKIKYYKSCLSYKVEHASVSTFLCQFSKEDFMGFTQSEMIHVIHSFVDDDTKKKFGQLGLIPGRMSYQEYEHALTSFRLGFFINEMDISCKLHDLNPKGSSLIQLYVDVSHLVDSVNDSIWTECDKDRQVHYFVKKYLPVDLKTAYDQLVVLGMDNTEIYPTREQQKTWILRNQKHVTNI